MACSSDIYSEVFTIVTCEGDLLDPRFPAQLEHLLGRLNEKLEKKVKVYKLEPWNSVRVTLSIPREAALHLRHLATEASQELRALGILSVQVEGDQVISLGLAESVNSELQHILNTNQDGSSNSGTNVREESTLQSPATVSAQSTSSDTNNAQMQFKSPNVVCPSDSVVPKVSTSTTTPSVVINANNKIFSGPFPFTSMNQAIHGGNREPGFNPLPPPYSGKHPPVTISSPLLVNLLQNDGTKESSNLKSNQPPVRIIRTPPTTTSQKVYNTSTLSMTTTPSVSNSNKPVNIATDVVSNNVSPSALSSTSIAVKKHGSSVLSTTNYKSAVKSPPPLPPQYNRGLVTTMVSKPMHPSFVDSQPQSRTSLSHTIVSPPMNNTAPSMTTQPAIQRQSVSEMPLSQPFASANINRISTTETNVAPTNPKLFQKHLSHGRTSPVKNFPIGRNTLSSMTLPPRKIFNIPSNNPTFLPNPLSSQADSLQSNEGSYIFQKLRATKDSFIQPPSNSSNISAQMMPSEGTTSSTATTVLPNADALNLNTPNFNNIMLRSMPSPPPYSVAISRTWDTPMNSNSLLDLTPSLTDLKPDDLEDLLPTLELTESPLPDLSDDFLNVNSNMSSTEETKLSSSENRTFLINPLTGELEPQPSDESDHEEMQDVFTGLRSPASLSDEDTCSISRFDHSTDQSDSEVRTTDKLPKLKNCSKDRGRDSPSLKQEKIKLRLKLEKSEPINPAYKVDVSYLNSHSKKATMVSSSEELRVPPLHISLRGRNSVVIKNKNKFSADGSVQKPKMKKSQDYSRIKKNDLAVSISKGDEIFDGINNSSIAENPEQMKMKMHVVQKKMKKNRTDQEQMEQHSNMATDSELKPPFFAHNQIKEKQKERRGSDSELVRNNKKYADNSGALLDDKKRRFSQTDQIEFDQPLVVGSTNVGTVTSIPQKPRKDKIKIRDVFRKEATKIKNLYKIGTDKLQHKLVSLPVASDMNMEAKFKQGLMEGNVEKAIGKLPHRTDAETNRADSNVITTRTDIPEDSKQKMLDPDPDKCDSIETKSSVELVEKSNSVPGSRSPNTGGGQGEDSGIESMDALSEKSPNQASQSPYADIPKTQVPNILDIEAQLAKMEGLERDTYRSDEHSSNIPTEDVNENKCHHDASSKLNQCCELTYVLQESMSSPPLESPNKQTETNFVAVKTEKEQEDLEPVPVRITPALYTYSNPEKGRIGLESPEGISDDDSNSCSTTSTIHSKPSKSLLEQLLIEIPNDHQNITNSPSPATRFSVRTRALSKLESPELNSSAPKSNKNVPSGKRKRHDSDSSNHSAEDNTKKPKKKTEAQRSEYPKARYPNDPNKPGNNRKTLKDESSDSDEPLIEKMKKSNTTVNIEVSNLVATKTKVKVGLENIANNNNKGWMVNTRRSVRSNITTQISKSKSEKSQSDSDALRRKTRSTVIEVEKRKKEVK